MKYCNAKKCSRHMTGGRKALSAILAILLGAGMGSSALAQQSSSPGQAGNATGQTSPAIATAETAEDVANLEPISPGFTSMELAEATLEQLPVCLEYKITGITLRVIITPWFVYYF